MNSEPMEEPDSVRTVTVTKQSPGIRGFFDARKRDKCATIDGIALRVRENAMKNDDKYLLCEQNWVFYTLMAVSGGWGAFTYLMRGGVFCNAQTGNLVLLGLAIGAGNAHKALYYLVPISSYIFGAFISEILPNPIKHHLNIRWDTLLIGVEIAVILLLGGLPESYPVQISQIAVNFIASMQYNTFRQAEGTPMATTFATNHIRQIGVGLAKEVRHWKRKDKSHRIRLKKHSMMVFSFLLGASIETLCCNLIQGRAIWITAIPLAYLFYRLIQDDKACSEERLEQKPSGH